MRYIWRVRAQGWQQLPETGGVLLLANHRSYTDALLIAATCPRPVRFLGAAKLQQYRFYRWLFRLCGVIPVSPEQARMTVRQAVAALRAGEVVIIFPEGTLNPYGPMLPWQNGWQLIQRQAGVGVLPVWLDYSHDQGQRSLHFRLWSRFRGMRCPWHASVRAGRLLEFQPSDNMQRDTLSEMLDLGQTAFAQRPQLEAHLAHAAFRNLRQHAGKTLFIDRSVDRRELKGGPLLAAALEMANLWREQLKDETRVGVVLPSGVGTVMANLALMFLDKTPVNLNFTTDPASLQSCMRRAGLKTVITAAPVRAKLKHFPWPDRVIDLVEERNKLSKARVARTLLMLRILPERLLFRMWRIPRLGGDREAGILFSSGSTSEPKGVVLTHRNILANCLQIFECRLLKDQVMLACLPTFHSFGFTVSVWYPLTMQLKTVMLPSPLETQKIADAIEEERCTLYLGTPTFFRPYLKKCPPEKLRSLFAVVAGAEKTPPGMHERWEQTFGSYYLEGYGLTETSPVVSVNLPPYGQEPAQTRAGSVGRLLTGMSARVTSRETGEPLPLGEVGVLELKGANVFKGYLDDPEGTAAVFRDGWFVTGDLARLDRDGFIYIEGRQSRFSKIGGEMVAHGKVEHALIDAFGWHDREKPVIAVTALPDDAKGERLLVLTTEPLDAADVRKRLAEQGLPNLWIPRDFIKVDEIPCLASGKLDLRVLRSLAEANA